MRKLVTIRKITALHEIENADRIQLADIDGWQTIVKKNEFSVGDVGVYFEIDSFLSDTDERFNFLEKIKRTWQNNSGYRIKTIKLKKQISQGLLLPLQLFPEITDPQFDTDYSELLNVIKWEAPTVPSLYSDAAGLFPSFLKKSDQERAQNINHKIFADLDKKYEITIKLDGSSMTCYSICQPGEDTGNENDLKIGVCSRNYDLKIPQQDEEIKSSFLKMFLNSGIQQALLHLGLDIGIQGELCGSAIQGNKEKLEGHKFFIYNIFDITTQKYMNTHQRKELFDTLKNIGVNDLVDHVPVLYEKVSLRELNITNIKELISFADGPSLNAKIREGLVFKSITDDFSFKIISNKWLLGMDE